jgi:hypothetical protein
MGLEVVAVPSGGGLGAYDYTPMTKNGQITSSATMGAFTTLLSVTGKGLLYKAISYGQGWTGSSLRITIDGTVVYWGTTSDTNTIGLFMSSDLWTSSTNTYPYIVGGASGKLPIISNPPTWANFPQATKQSVSQPLVVLNAPIKFNSSLLIEVCNESNASKLIDYGIGYSLAG